MSRVSKNSQLKSGISYNRGLSFTDILMVTFLIIGYGELRLHLFKTFPPEFSQLKAKEVVTAQITTDYVYVPQGKDLQGKPFGSSQHFDKHGIFVNDVRTDGLSVGFGAFEVELLDDDMSCVVNICSMGIDDSKRFTERRRYISLRPNKDGKGPYILFKDKEADNAQIVGIP